MRITKKDELFRQKMGCNYSPNYRLSDCIEKLGQLEDIEEELGIDLVTLVKALKNGFFDKDGEYHHFSNLLVSLDEIGDCYDKKSFNLKDYGKTWALTREELEK